MADTVARPSADHDVAVQATTDDACVSKLSAIQKGYFDDPFMKHFVRRPVRRAPLINRGYYTRVQGIRLILSRFLTAGGPDVPKQIISLGGGLDTTFFWLHSQNMLPSGGFFDVDFAEVTAKKVEIMSKHADMMSAIGGEALVSADRTEVRSSLYKLVAADLRDVSALQTRLVEAGLQTNVPTLLLAECVLVYMEADHADSLLNWAAHTFPSSMFVSYDIIKPNDPFGVTMLENLESRGCSLLSVRKYPEISDHINRYKTLGWESVEIIDMNEMYDEYLDRTDLRRIERLELFDELEEWRLIQAHYCFSCAIQNKQNMPFLASLNFSSFPPQTAPPLPSFASHGPLGTDIHTSHDKTNLNLKFIS